MAAMLLMTCAIYCSNVVVGNGIEAQHFIKQSWSSRKTQLWNGCRVNLYICWLKKVLCPGILGRWIDENHSILPPMYGVYIKISDHLPDSKVHGANMGPIWGRQDPGGPHIGPMNLAIWVYNNMLWMWEYLQSYSVLYDTMFILIN